MPKIRNRTAYGFDLRIGRHLEAGGVLDVTDQEAAELAGHPLLDIETPKPKKEEV